VTEASARDQLLGRAIEWFAANGVGDSSLRTLAEGIGTSHRMINYHFGSRDGLLGAVVEAVERGEREVLATMLAGFDDPLEVGAAFWVHVADRATIFAPLFFELSGQAMQGKPYAASLRSWLGTGWLDELTDGFERTGWSPDAAALVSRMSLAMARGLLFDLAVTGDRSAVDAAMARWTEMVSGTS
jgi:AcrR family transcriptional regulator